MSLFDDIIGQVDGALRTLAGLDTAKRENPAALTPDADLSEAHRQHAAGLMRVNHAGEICAQALYEGQALVARDEHTRQALRDAAREETDHLVWCNERLHELDSAPSRLNPLFYAASYLMGAATGLMGDRVSLGFVEATEDQVCKHLEAHLQALPAEDTRSRRIVEKMHEDEARHGAQAMAAGGVEFPAPVKGLMTLVSKVMTETTYRI
jgi:ubiquinone biosynthesis monooxygenase Coq7